MRRSRVLSERSVRARSVRRSREELAVFGGAPCAYRSSVYDGDVQLGGRQSTPWQRRVGAQISLAWKSEQAHCQRAYSTAQSPQVRFETSSANKLRLSPPQRN